MMLFTWSRASENLDCYPKMGPIVFTIFRPAPGGMFSLSLLEAKKKEKAKKLFSCHQVKANLLIFHIFNFELYFWQLFFEVQ